jgi:mannan endo-1,6-alpha-mannosidase
MIMYNAVVVEFLTVARQVFEWIWTNGWDEGGACGGGMWWDYTNTSKEAITNVQMLQLGARLYRLQNDTTDKALLAQVLQQWKFIVTNQLVNPVTYLTAARAVGSHDNCTHNGDYRWSYLDGVMIGGLVELSHILHEQSYLDLAHRIANATIVAKSINGTFMSACDLATCDHITSDNAKMFKGIFVRNLRYLMDASNETMQARYKPWLQFNMASVINNSRCEPNGSLAKCHVVFLDGPPCGPKSVPVFSEKWGGPFNYSAPMQQASAMDLFVSNIPPGTICKGDNCQYNPPEPSQQFVITCKDGPCPPGERCCQQGNIYSCCLQKSKCMSDGCQK